MFSGLMFSGLTVSGLTVSISLCGQVMDLKPDLMAALAPVTAKEAPERDTGHIPGDRRGAAGEIFFKYIFLDCVDLSFAYIAHFVFLMFGFEPRELP
jgi:hypothetical protein